MTTVRILEEEPYGVISPRVYGHFAEHLGRCCYDGIWVGKYSEIPNHGGFRTDCLEALKALPVPLLRWPGGCYADHYHWRDGIGEPKDRPIRLGLSCGLQVQDDNALGTHEFLEYCSHIGAEPYLAGNMGSGSVQEMCDWVEYCNATVSTTLVKERKMNGRQSAWGVKLWGVGNENWGCGGCYSAESYGLEYRRYASMLKHVDSTTELVVCGNDSTWNRSLIPSLRNHAGLVDHYSIHRYWINGGPGLGFSDEHYYNLLDEAEATEEFIKETRELLDEIDPARRIGIGLDEWGVWHADARDWGPSALGNCGGDYSQAATLRDAIATAVAFEGFHRQAKSLSLANLAQVANVLHAPICTFEGNMWLTPTYHVLRLHARHLGATALRTEIEGSPTLPNGKASLSATASRSGETKALTVTNRHMFESIELEIPDWVQAGEILSAESAHSHNGLVDPHAVQLTALQILERGRQRVAALPPHSVATLQS